MQASAAHPEPVEGPRLPRIAILDCSQTLTEQRDDVKLYFTDLVFYGQLYTCQSRLFMTRQVDTLTAAVREYEQLLLDYFNEGLHGPLSLTSARFLVGRAIELFAIDIETDDTATE